MRYLAPLEPGRGLLVNFNRRYKPSKLIAELIAQHTAIGLGREFNPSECMRLTVEHSDVDTFNGADLNAISDRLFSSIWPVLG